jgi:hypothetical protein
MATKSTVGVKSASLMGENVYIIKEEDLDYINCRIQSICERMADLETRMKILEDTVCVDTSCCPDTQDILGCADTVC